MRCPVCRKNTPGAMSRCTRCNASLSDHSATTREPPSEQWPPTPWQPESGGAWGDADPAQPWPAERDEPRQEQGGAPGPPLTGADAPETRHEEPRELGRGKPWGSQAADPWVAEAAFGADLEHTTTLSPEPWAQSEPEMWQPPPERRRNKVLPFLITAAGALVLVLVALGIIFWPSGEKKGADRRDAPAAQSQPAGSESPTTEGASEAAKEQADKVNGLLDSMATTRGDLGTVVTGGCQISGLERVRDDRQEQLRTARSLEVAELNNGTELKDALVKALEASVQSNQTYLDHAPGCPPESAVSGINAEASGAKDEVIRHWGPIAEQLGLPSRSAGSI